MSQTTVKNPPRSIAVGTHVDGRYRIIGPLGEGGVGAVYEAEHINLGLRVALKVLHDQGSDPDMRGRFEREAKGLALLSHPRIVGVTDFGFVDDIPYLVMELLEGESLRANLERQLPSVELAIDYTLQILDALEHAHEKGIVHRDLKPPNVWVGGTSSAPMLKLLDFGFAKFLDGGVNPMLTGEGIVLGTPAYISPEQASAGPADHRSDLYAVAVMFFEMLAGRRPFEGDPIEMLRGHLTKPVPRLAELRRALAGRGALQTLVDKGLAKAPAERFQSASEFADALRALPADERRPLDATRRSLSGEVESAGAKQEGVELKTLDEHAPEERETDVDVPSGAPPALELDPNATMQLDAEELLAVEAEEGEPNVSENAYTRDGDRGDAAATRAAPARRRAPSQPTEFEAAETEFSGGEGADERDPAATLVDASPAGRRSDEELWPAATLAGAKSATPSKPKPSSSILKARSAFWVGGGVALVLLLGLIVVLTMGDASEPAAEEPVSSEASESFAEQNSPAEETAAPTGADPLQELLGKDLGASLTSDDLRKLAVYSRQHREDPRPHLMMASAYFERGSLLNAQTRYEWAYRADPESRHAPDMLENLVALVGRAATSNRASILIRKAYGKEAAAVIESSLAKAEPDSYEARRLAVLKGKLD